MSPCTGRRLCRPPRGRPAASVDSMGEDREEAVAGPRRRPRPPSRTVLTVVVAVLITFTVAGTLGNIFLAPLRKHHPLVVLLLDARNRQLILVSNRMDTASFII